MFEARAGGVFGGFPNTVPALPAAAGTASNAAFNQRMTDQGKDHNAKNRGWRRLWGNGDGGS